MSMLFAESECFVGPKYTYFSYQATHTTMITIIGVELTLRHIRDGVELEPIDINRNYDFNFQQTNYIPRVKILPVSEIN